LRRHYFKQETDDEKMPARAGIFSLVTLLNLEKLLLQTCPECSISAFATAEH
jgi:hypothetical protein